MRFRSDSQRRAVFASMSSDDPRKQALRAFHADNSRRKIAELKEKGKISNEIYDPSLATINDAGSPVQMMSPSLIYSEVSDALNSGDIDTLSKYASQFNFYSDQQKNVMRKYLEGKNTDESSFIEGNLFSRDKNSSRGKRFEQKIHARVGRSDSIVTMRSTGSRGMWDVVAITPTKVRLIQAKTHGYLTPADREKMLEQLQEMPDNVQAELEYYESPRVSKNFTLKKAGEQDWDKVEERLEHFAKVRGYSKNEVEDEV
jgi:hypothetical protein